MPEQKRPSVSLVHAARATCCRHGFSDGPEDGFDACCICREYPMEQPCERVNALMAVEHGESWRSVERAWREESVAYALEHGHVPLDPWGVLDECPPTCRKGSSTLGGEG